MYTFYALEELIYSSRISPCLFYVQSRAARTYVFYLAKSTTFILTATAVQGFQIPADIAGAGGEWVARFLELHDEDNLSTLEDVTYDSLVGYMKQGMTRYMDSLQTTLPDLSEFYENGGKIIHFHGEQDESIPTGSSVHYYNSVRQTMYPGKSYNASTAALKECYKLFLVPGAAHCDTNTAEPNGPFPQTTFEVMSRWVDKGIEPVTLNATILQGEYEGNNEQLCAWPLRPYWKNGGKNFTCEYDQASIDTFNYNFDAYKLPLY